MLTGAPPDGWWDMGAWPAAAQLLSAQTNPNHPWVGGPPYVNVETGESKDKPPDGWQDTAQTNPNHPWEGGPPYVNVETGESRDTPPDGWQMNPNHPWVGGPPYVNTETGESRGTLLCSRLSLHMHDFSLTVTLFPSRLSFHA